MKRALVATLGLALCLSVSTVEAKHKNHIKTLTGCVEGSAGHYELSTITKKGKHRDYALVGDRDFSTQVGHKIQARGAVEGHDLKVSAVKDLGSSCQ